MIRELERLYTVQFPNVPALEVRSLPNRRNGMKIGGYSAVFGAPSDPRLGFRESFEPGFFNKSQGDGWPHARALFEHLPGIVLGTVRSGTLRLGIDQRGLNYEVDLAPSRVDVYEGVERGDIYGSSAAFRVFQDDWRRGTDGVPVRHLVSGQLDHVSPTSTPAYPDCSVALRSLAIQLDADYEEIERDARANELRRYFERTDQIVRATPTIMPATVEMRNSAEPHADPALVSAMARSRHRALGANRPDRVELDQLRRKNEQRATTIELERMVTRHSRRMVPSTPEQRSIDGRDYYRQRVAQ